MTDHENFTINWTITGTRENLRAIPIDFIDGSDCSIDELNLRDVRILVRETDVLLSYSDVTRDDAIARAFSRRHPDVLINVVVKQTGADLEYASFENGQRTTHEI